MPHLQKKTLRNMPETSRKVGRLLNEIDSLTHRLRNLIPDIVSLERDSIAFMKASEIVKGSKEPKRRHRTAGPAQDTGDNAAVSPQDSILEVSLPLTDQQGQGLINEDTKHDETGEKH